MKQRIVIKLGGSSLHNKETVKELAALIRGYQKRRYHVVLVHGGGPAINEALAKENISWKFIDGQRQTTPQMMTVIDRVLATEVNGTLVENLKAEKVSAVGISGADSKVLFCSAASKELMLVGKVDEVNPQSIKEILNQFGGKVPVIAPIGLGKDHQKYNINADWAAAQIAVALQAKKLIFLTDQDGILNEQKKLVPLADAVMIDEMISTGIISGGMSTKVKAMLTALNSGISQVRVLHASFSSLLLTAEKIGTVLMQMNKMQLRPVRVNQVQKEHHGRAS